MIFFLIDIRYLRYAATRLDRFEVFARSISRKSRYRSFQCTSNTVVPVVAIIVYNRRFLLGLSSAVRRSFKPPMYICKYSTEWYRQSYHYVQLRVTCGAVYDVDATELF